MNTVRGMVDYRGVPEPAPVIMAVFPAKNTAIIELRGLVELNLGLELLEARRIRILHHC